MLNQTNIEFDFMLLVHSVWRQHVRQYTMVCYVYMCAMYYSAYCLGVLHV